MQSPILKFVKRKCYPLPAKAKGCPVPPRTEVAALPSPVECSFNLPFNSTFVSGVEFLITHTPDPSQGGGAGLGGGAELGEVLVGAEVGTGQPSVSIEYASQARLRLENYAAQTHTHTHARGGDTQGPTPPTHTRKQVNSIWLVYPAHKLIQWNAPNALSLAH